MNIPPISNIETALLIYYSHSEIGNKEITDLFGQRSSATISRLKKLAKDEMKKQGVYSYGAYKVNTKAAFNAWGLDVQDMEKRIEKLKKLYS